MLRIECRRCINVRNRATSNGEVVCCVPIQKWLGIYVDHWLDFVDSAGSACLAAAPTTQSNMTPLPSLVGSIKPISLMLTPSFDFIFTGCWVSPIQCARSPSSLCPKPCSKPNVPLFDAIYHHRQRVWNSVFQWRIRRSVLMPGRRGVLWVNVNWVHAFDSTQTWWQVRYRTVNVGFKVSQGKWPLFLLGTAQLRACRPPVFVGTMSRNLILLATDGVARGPQLFIPDSQWLGPFVLHGFIGVGIGCVFKNDRHAQEMCALWASLLA